MATGLQAVRGMNDVLPDEAPLWERFEDTARSVFAQYGYRNIRVPIVESTALFVRGIGEFTDVVEKEMYTFEDKLNGDSLTLRPEATAGIVRATIQHNLIYDRPQRVWTTGPMFRHERPQKGRYRQFHQVDAEALGFEGPGRRRRADRDARAPVEDARAVGYRAADQLDRQRPRAAGASRATGRVPRTARRPARRRREAPAARESAAHPRQQEPGDAGDDRGRPEAHRLHRGRVARALRGTAAAARGCGTRYEINPRLVRGLDYYNRTVFEWVATSDELGAQGTVAGGGRYDGLFELVGGKPSFACGFAIGVERMILLLRAAGATAAAAPLAYVVHSGDAAGLLARRVAEALRDEGHAVVVNAGGGSFKSQMKKADASGAQVALIVGDEEAATSTVAIKPLRASGDQIAVARGRRPGPAGFPFTVVDSKRSD